MTIDLAYHIIGNESYITIGLQPAKKLGVENQLMDSIPNHMRMIIKSVLKIHAVEIEGLIFKEF